MSDRVIGKGNGGAVRPYVYREQHRDDDKVSLSVTVYDEPLRRLGIPHDGYEKVFALVPKENGQWERHELSYYGTSTDRGGGPPADSFHVMLDGCRDNFRLDDLRSQGVAFGLQVKGQGGEETTVWLQGFGDNYKLGGGG